MIVDCHTHISAPDGKGVSLEHFAAAETVDVSIVLAAVDNPSEQSNSKASQYAARYKGKMVGFAVIDPTKDAVSVKSLKALMEKTGFKGLVLYCSNHRFHPAHTRAMRLYESAAELKLPIFFHNAGHLEADAVLDYAQPYLLDEVARTFPSLKIVIGSMGKPFVEQTISMVAKHENVYADLTIRTSAPWDTYNTVLQAYERGVMDKLLFGSGFPACTAKECIETLLGFNKLLGDTTLPAVPRVAIRNVIERDSLELLGIEK